MYYLSYDDIIQIYSKVVEVSGGGFAGVLDTGKVKGILEQVKNDLYYPEIEDKLTYLFYSFGKYHCFTDGNKRIALAASIAFLNYNGKELLHKIISSIIYENDFSEALKTEIALSLQNFNGL